jgi:hypothetical protein
MNTPEELRNIASEAKIRKYAAKEQENIKCAEPFVPIYRKRILKAATNGHMYYEETAYSNHTKKDGIELQCSIDEMFAGLSSIFRKEGFDASSKNTNYNNILAFSVKWDK